MSWNKSRFLRNWHSCLFKVFAQEQNMEEKHWLVIWVSDVIGSFVDKGTVAHADKEPAWQVNDEEEERWGDEDNLLR